MRAAKREDPIHMKGLRAIATMELVKGAIVVAMGFGLITLSRHDIDMEDIASGLLYFLHLGPPRRLYSIFLDVAAKFDDMNLMRLAILASVYSTLRFVEAYGLWRARVWAEWLAIVSGCIYLPLEILEISHKPTALKWLVLVLNIGIVSYMAWLRLQAHGVAVLPRRERTSEGND